MSTADSCCRLRTPVGYVLLLLSARDRVDCFRRRLTTWAQAPFVAETASTFLSRYWSVVVYAFSIDEAIYIIPVSIDALGESLTMFIRVASQKSDYSYILMSCCRAYYCPRMVLHCCIYSRRTDRNIIAIILKKMCCKSYNNRPLVYWSRGVIESGR